MLKNFTEVWMRNAVLILYKNFKWENGKLEWANHVWKTGDFRKKAYSIAQKWYFYYKQQPKNQNRPVHFLMNWF